ncbi:MAG: F0F1 ATP synthase subunit B [Chloroflexota bacterium]|nr:F0F1 ATP synthase subunit B [Anaerolineales bacterium]MCA9976147.1 F0F1 ATP synthase subunit B [Anaerolineales bacterium]MCB8966231.1 F0F1 ATP synthase subunit B [Ardenticatenaceae bacterium]
MEALGINLGYLIMQVLGITILLLLLKGLLYGPMLRVLDERQAKIAKGLEDQRQAAIARDNADADAKKILDSARQEAAKIRQDAAAQGDETRKSIVAQAEEEAKKIKADAAVEAEQERDRILADLRSQVAAIAVAAANKLVGASLDDARQRQLIADFFAKVPASVAQMSGESAVVTSALPLTEAEQGSVKQALKAQSVSFRVDPSILGGLIVRIGDRVVDDSVASRMGALRDSLN